MPRAIAVYGQHRAVGKLLEIHQELPDRIHIGIVRGNRSGSVQVISREDGQMPDYRIVYGDNAQVIRTTYHDVQAVREDEWVVLFRGEDA